MLKKIYLEITNVCNLSCGFCHGTSRAPRFLSPADFRRFAQEARKETPYFYLHVLGEPLLHPQLDELLAVCDALDARVTLTTNGTLIGKAAETLLSHKSLYKTAFSLHAFAANFPNGDPEGYLAPVLRYAKKAEGKSLIVYKFWNGASADEAKNAPLLEALRRAYPEYEAARGGVRLARGVYIEFADRFSWPDPEGTGKAPRFCMALRDQAAVLVDGTVVPCCLDADGRIPLGNLYSQSLREILSSPRAQALVRGFSEGRTVEALCKTCPFAAQKFGTA